MSLIKQYHQRDTEKYIELRKTTIKTPAGTFIHRSKTKEMTERLCIKSKYDYAKLVMQITEPVITIAERIVSGDASVDCEVLLGDGFFSDFTTAYTVLDEGVDLIFEIIVGPRSFGYAGTNSLSGDIKEFVTFTEVDFLLYFAKQAYNKQCDKRDELIRIEKQKKRQALHDKYKALEAKL